MLYGNNHGYSDMYKTVFQEDVLEGGPFTDVKESCFHKVNAHVDEAHVSKEP